MCIKVYLWHIVYQFGDGRDTLIFHNNIMYSDWKYIKKTNMNVNFFHVKIKYALVRKKWIKNK